MVTLSCLIVLASLYSQLSSSLPSSASSKAIEILFFFYIAKLSCIFVTQTSMLFIRSYRQRKEEKAKKTEDFTEKFPYNTSRKVAVMPENAKVAFADGSFTKKNKSYTFSLKFLEWVCLVCGLALDILVIGGFYIQITSARNKIIIPEHFKD